MYTASKMLESLAFISLLSLYANYSLYAGAMVCESMQELEEATNKPRWVFPVPEPCRCTQIGLGGVNTVAPDRPFKVVYHDNVMMSNNASEIRKWLNCTACHFSTVPHPKPYSYMFILEPFASPFTVNFSVKTGVAAIVGLSENRTDASVFAEILFGYRGGTKIVFRACMPHLCSKTRAGTVYGRYEESSRITVGTEYRPFWIHYNEGVVTAGKGGQQTALVEWDAGAHHGRVPTQVHIGISTWEKGYGKWDFCQ